MLLVSTDPASNVGQVFGQPIGNTITAVASVPGLDALEIDPEQAAAEYRERIIGPVRGLLPEPEIVSITEQLSGSCTTEIASFNEFTGLLADPSLIADYDNVIFDTAPTGHTIRLLKLPGDWTGVLDAGNRDAMRTARVIYLQVELAEQLRRMAATVPPDLPHRCLNGQVRIPQQLSQFLGADHRQERQRRLPIRFREHPYELRGGHVNMVRQGPQGPVSFWRGA